MEEKLWNLINEQQYRDILENKDFIDKFIETVVVHRNLEDYVKRIDRKEVAPSSQNRIDLDSSIVAIYNVYNKEICIYKKGLVDCLNFIKSYSSRCSAREQVRLPYVFLASFLLHELEHVSQTKLMDNDHHSFESKLLQISTSYVNIKKTYEMLVKKGLDPNYISIPLDKLKRRKEIYKLHGDLSLEERLAEINSYNWILSILKVAPNENRIATILMKSFLRYYTLMGYQKENGFITSPTISYINLSGENELSEFDWYNENPTICLQKLKQQLTLEKRLKYGLYIDENEYQNIQKQYRKGM